MSRYVVIRVDDKRVTHLCVDHCYETDTREGEVVPVPRDDRLAEAVREAVDTLQGDADDMLAWARTECDGEPDKADYFRRGGERKSRMADALRAAFGLDEEEA